MKEKTQLIIKNLTTLNIKTTIHNLQQHKYKLIYNKKMWKVLSNYKQGRLSLNSKN